MTRRIGVPDDARYVVGVDVGGTKTALGVVAPDGSILRESVGPTAPTAVEGLRRVAATVAHWSHRYPLAAVGLVLPGLIVDDVVHGAVNLTGWNGVPLRPALARACALPAVVANDGHAAAWGEYVHGGHGGEDLLCLTLGTGLGGGLVLQGRPYVGSGFAGEVGHMVLVPDGRPCGCGSAGCWERYVSGTALAADAVERLDADTASPDSPLGVLRARHATITARAVVAAAREGDRIAAAAVAALAGYLGEGLAKVVALLDPHTVVVGGGLGAAADLLIPIAERRMREHLPSARRQVGPLRRATLGSRAGLVGAAALARNVAVRADGTSPVGPVGPAGSVRRIPLDGLLTAADPAGA